MEVVDSVLLRDVVPKGVEATVLVGVTSLIRVVPWVAVITLVDLSLAGSVDVKY